MHGYRADLSVWLSFFLVHITGCQCCAELWCRTCLVLRGSGRISGGSLAASRGSAEGFLGSRDVPRWPLSIVVTTMAAVYHRNKKLSYCWETVRRESMSRIAEMDVEMTT